jgi:hypothetical protein
MSLVEVMGGHGVFVVGSLSLLSVLTARCRAPSTTARG